MWMALSIAAMIFFCMVFWGTIAIILTLRWSMFGIGSLAFLGGALLVWVVSFIYWAIDLLMSRKRIRSKIMVADKTQDFEEKRRLEKRLLEEKWNTVFIMSGVVMIYIVGFGIFIPLYIVQSLKEFTCEFLQKHFCKKTI